MGQLSTNVIYHGIDQRPPLQYEIHAGPLTMLYDNGDLRYIKLGEREILRRVYVGVRDQNWGTLKNQINNQTLQIHANWFRLTYEAIYRQGDIDLMAWVEIMGTNEGLITFELDSVARTTFHTNRTGFCVLHPATLAGQPCLVEHVDGTTQEGFFPDHVSPHQPFFNIRAIQHEVSPTVRARVLMEGDTFEMEDQRNWGDATYKTYCTPSERPIPALIEKDTHIRQKITISLQGKSEDDTHISLDKAPAIALNVSAADREQAVPGIGLGLSGGALNDLEIARLRLMHLSHLRVEIRLWRDDIAEVLKNATTQARALGIGLEIALFLSQESTAVELNAFRHLLDEIRPPVTRWIVLNRAESTTSEKSARLAREFFGDYDRSALFGAGTDANFTELNRTRPPQTGIDFVSYSLNPQVHAVADVDLMENMIPLASTARDARHFSDVPVVVSPLTLKRRGGSSANPDGATPQTNELPTPVDPRQMSLVGAVWTLGTFKYLAESGVMAATYYETTGWRGVMERETGSAMPDHFRSIASGVYPLYHVLVDIGEFAGGEVIPCISGDPLTVEALVLRKGERVRLLIANLTPRPQGVRVMSGLREGQNPVSVVVKSLDEMTAQDAMTNPEGWRGMPGVRVSFGATWQHALKPYAILRVDVE